MEFENAFNSSSNFTLDANDISRVGGDEKYTLKNLKTLLPQQRKRKRVDDNVNSPQFHVGEGQETSPSPFSRIVLHVCIVQHFIDTSMTTAAT